MNKLLKIYIVELNRWGSKETHHYLIGSYATYNSALKEAKVAMTMRAGKYDAIIYESWPNQHTIEIYRVIHWGDFDSSKYDLCGVKNDKVENQKA